MVRANLLWSTVGLSLLGLVNAIPVRSSVPGPDSLGTDVAILTHNDLYGMRPIHCELSTATYTLPLQGNTPPGTSPSLSSIPGSRRLLPPLPVKA